MGIPVKYVYYTLSFDSKAVVMDGNAGKGIDLISRTFLTTTCSYFFYFFMVGVTSVF